jgi:hypothetical protein
MNQDWWKSNDKGIALFVVFFIRHLLVADSVNYDNKAIA